jgi:hyperosmotically inducible protein
MMRSVYYLLSVVLLATSLTAGCVALTGKTAGRNIDDATITASVKTNLAAQRADTLTKIDVDTNDGVVSLNGVVDSVEMKRQAADVARQTAGVEKVINNLQVQAARG